MNVNYNKVTKEEIIKIILSYEKELKEERDEAVEHFGHSDESSKRAWCQWIVIDKLVERLSNAENENGK